MAIVYFDPATGRRRNAPSPTPRPRRAINPVTGRPWGERNRDRSAGQLLAVLGTTAAPAALAHATFLRPHLDGPGVRRGCDARRWTAEAANPRRTPWHRAVGGAWSPHVPASLRAVYGCPDELGGDE